MIFCIMKRQNRRSRNKKVSWKHVNTGFSFMEIYTNTYILKFKKSDFTHKLVTLNISDEDLLN